MLEPVRRHASFFSIAVVALFLAPIPALGEAGFVLTIQGPAAETLSLPTTFTGKLTLVTGQPGVGEEVALFVGSTRVASAVTGPTGDYAVTYTFPSAGTFNVHTSRIGLGGVAHPTSPTLTIAI
jgi:hypothetical protein